MRILVISGSPRGILAVGWPEKGILHAPRFKEDAETYLKAARDFGHDFGSGSDR